MRPRALIALDECWHPLGPDAKQPHGVLCGADENARRVQTIPGVGPITASTSVSQLAAGAAGWLRAEEIELAMLGPTRYPHDLPELDERLLVRRESRPPQLVRGGVAAAGERQQVIGHPGAELPVRRAPVSRAAKPIEAIESA